MFDFKVKERTLTCAKCAHAINFGDTTCICNYTRDIKFYNNFCNNTGSYEEDKHRIRKVFISLAYITNIADDVLQYINTGVGLYVDTNQDDNKIIQKFYEDIDDKFLSHKFAAQGLRYDFTNIKPIIFAEKVNGHWKLLFNKYSRETAELLFNNLQ